MLNITLVCACILFLLIPLVLMCLYGYTREGAWRPLFFGCGWQVFIQLLMRIVLPALLVTQAWFMQFAEDPVGFGMAFSAVQTLLEIGAFALTIYNFQKKDSPKQWSLVFGLSYGAMQSALFVGFSSLSLLLSTEASATNVSVSGLWMSIGEGLCLIFIYGWIAFMVEKSMSKKRWIVFAWMTPLLFGFLLIGYWWSSLFGFPQIVRLGLLVLCAAGAAYVMRDPLSALFLPEDKKKTGLQEV